MEFESPTSSPIQSDFISDPPPFPIVLPPYTVAFPSPIHPSLLFSMDNQRSISLLQFMINEGLVPSAEEEEKRKKVIHKLKQIVSSWIKKVAWQHQLPKHQIESTSATILTYGSYGLGVHNSESDIDALCVAPFFASIAEDFFVVLHDMLKKRPEVSYIHCVKSAKVPLMRFKFDGISIDLPYARLNLLYVPENIDILNPFFMRNIDDTSWKSLSGVRVNKLILHLVPTNVERFSMREILCREFGFKKEKPDSRNMNNFEKFQSMLRCLKLWAKRRGVYGTLLGYLGGIHMTVLAAYVFQRYRGATLNALIMIFFQTFAFWPWPTPVVLQEGMLLTIITAIQTRSLMPIILPSHPYEYCQSSITTSTFFRIKTEFLRAHNMTRDILKPDFIWDNVFEPFPYSKVYSNFVKIYLSYPNNFALGDWVGWVKSRFRSLLQILERIQGFCDPNPTEYVDSEKMEPNVAFYWGLRPCKYNFMDIGLVRGEFMKIINYGYEGSPGRIELSILLASQLPN